MTCAMLGCYIEAALPPVVSPTPFLYPYWSVWPISSLPVPELAFWPLLFSNNTWKMRAGFPVPANVNFAQTKLCYSWKFSTKSSFSLVFSEKTLFSSQACCHSVTFQLFLRGSENNCRFLLTQQLNNSKAYSSIISVITHFGQVSCLAWEQLLLDLSMCPHGQSDQDELEAQLWVFALWICQSWVVARICTNTQPCWLGLSEGHQRWALAPFCSTSLFW